MTRDQVTGDDVHRITLERIAHAPLGVDPGELRAWAREGLERAQRMGVRPLQLPEQLPGQLPLPHGDTL